MIRSNQNQRIKWVRSLQADSKARREARLFVVEGVRLVEEALDSGSNAEWVIYTQDISDRGKEIIGRFMQISIPVDEVSPQVMQFVSDIQSPQGILAVFQVQTYSVPGSIDLLLIPDSIRDPGNLGTIFRTAVAAGVQAILIPPGSVDPYAPKVLRAAMGAHFYMSIEMLSWDDIYDLVKRNNLNVFLADVHQGTPYTEANLRDPLALIIGGEAEGAGSRAQNLATQFIRIPMPGHTESLNAGIATGILLFEALRQRRAGKDPG